MAILLLFQRTHVEGGFIKGWKSLPACDKMLAEENFYSKHTSTASCVKLSTQKEISNVAIVIVTNGMREKRKSLFSLE